MKNAVFQRLRRNADAMTMSMTFNAVNQGARANYDQMRRALDRQ